MERRRTLGNEVESVMSEEYELVGTASITEEMATVEIQLSKPCTDLYLLCEDLKATTNSQLLITIATNNRLNGINGELSANAQNTIQHIKKVGKTWIRTGNNHGIYGLNVASAQMYRMATMPNKLFPESITRITLSPLYDSHKFTSGTIKIYGR